MTVTDAILIGLFCHFLGDYVFQSHWMAVVKTERWSAALIHGLTYTLPFLVITRNPIALLIIGGTHAVIDRYRLAKRLVWLKNFLAPRNTWRSWQDCSATGFPPETPVWLSTWLLIIVDNFVHVGINSITLWGLR